jgi:hypothetical protein
MPLFYKKDVTATNVAYYNGLLADRRSCITLPDSTGRAHVRLEGLDRSLQRTRCFAKAKGHCEVCGKPLNIETFEMHHPAHCDCIDRKCPTRVEARCSQWDGDCHRHHSEGFKRKADAVKVFNRVDGDDSAT